MKTEDLEYKQYFINQLLQLGTAPLSVVDIGHCTVTHCDAGGVSLVNQ